MTTLYTYCIRFDSGAAPNPFWGRCTLTICKPVIRRVARVGDWVVGMGSKNSPIGDVSGKVIYAMKVTEIMTMAEYDVYTREDLPDKIPDLRNNDVRRKLGDSIYDFTKAPPVLRWSVHTIKHRKRDLGGKNALISDHFYYFGNKPIDLPEGLNPIIKSGPGHKSKCNAPYVEEFIDWLAKLNLPPNELCGAPQEQRFGEIIVRGCEKS